RRSRDSRGGRRAAAGPHRSPRAARLSAAPVSRHHAQAGRRSGVCRRMGERVRRVIHPPSLVRLWINTRSPFDGLRVSGKISANADPQPLRLSPSKPGFAYLSTAFGKEREPRHPEIEPASPLLIFHGAPFVTGPAQQIAQPGDDVADSANVEVPAAVGVAGYVTLLDEFEQRPAEQRRKAEL